MPPAARAASSLLCRCPLARVVLVALLPRPFPRLSASPLLPIAPDDGAQASKWPVDKRALDDCVLRRMFVVPAFEIHGCVGGCVGHARARAGCLTRGEWLVCRHTHGLLPSPACGAGSTTTARRGARCAKTSSRRGRATFCSRRASCRCARTEIGRAARVGRRLGVVPCLLRSCSCRLCASLSPPPPPPPPHADRVHDADAARRAKDVRPRRQV